MADRSPVIRRLVMFKHGVAYLERGGPAAGAFELSFRRDEMNDVLKSLAVWVAAGEGQVGAVTFESPEDPEDALRERGLLFERGAALSELVHALRGRRVRVGVGPKEHEGDVLGLEVSHDAEGRERQRLLLRGDEETVTVVDGADVSRLGLLEPHTRADVQWLVDKSRAATSREHRTVRVDLSGDAEDLRVAYTVPSPMWRVSYRLVVGDDDEVTVMAWAIIHNPADEDLERVELTLTTGQPVSFVIDLYKPRHVTRAVVAEKERAVAAPREIERAKRKAAPAPGAPPPPAARPMMPGPAGAAAPAPQAVSFGLADSLESFEGAAESGDRADFFEYRVRTPLDLRRGGSAMVPLAAAKVKGRRERIWRPGQGPAPDIVLAFDNETGLVLEEGPGVVYDDDGYAGEAMVPFSARGAEVRLAFARDLPVRCFHQSSHSVFLAGLKIADAAAMEVHERRFEHTLRVENDHTELVTVLFELPRTHTHEIAKSSPQPVETTAHCWRFAVEAPAGETAEVKVLERWTDHVRLDMTSLNAARLRNWRSGDFVDDALQGELRKVLSLWESADGRDREADRLDQERSELYQRQQGLTQQLGVLREGGDEGALRLTYAQDLRKGQERIDELTQAIGDAREGARKLRAEAYELLASVKTPEA